MVILIECFMRRLLMCVPLFFTNADSGVRRKCSNSSSSKSALYSGVGLICRKSCSHCAVLMPCPSYSTSAFNLSTNPSNFLLLYNFTLSIYYLMEEGICYWMKSAMSKIPVPSSQLHMNTFSIPNPPISFISIDSSKAPSHLLHTNPSLMPAPSDRRYLRR
jgi:hypothetical protein